jgi:copper transporter 1
MSSEAHAEELCKTSLMLWNWNTNDLCLISSKWHITSPAMFAASCLAIALLAMSLPLLRRMSKEYDKRILRDHRKRANQSNGGMSTHPSRHSSTSSNASSVEEKEKDRRSKSGQFKGLMTGNTYEHNPGKFRPHLLQHLVRGILHLSQFVVAYFTMLIFMLLNGYLIFSILGGIFLGFVLFEWETVETS